MTSIGPMLGRLTPLKDPNSGQEFPEDWGAEMDCLSDIGANCVEWIIVDEKYNPLYDKIDLSSYPIVSINVHSLTQAEASEYFIESVCAHASKHHIKRLVLPLLDASSSIEIINLVKRVARKHPLLSFSLETEIQARELLQIIGDVENLYVTYDTGNFTALNLNHEEEIYTLGNKIDNVHLKDRVSDGGPNVVPGNGDTDFGLVFRCLRDIGYSNPFILETFRGPPGKEKQTVARYIEEFLCLI